MQHEEEVVIDVVLMEQCTLRGGSGVFISIGVRTNGTEICKGASLSSHTEIHARVINRCFAAFQPHSNVGMLRKRTTGRADEFPAPSGIFYSNAIVVRTRLLTFTSHVISRQNLSTLARSGRSTGRFNAYYVAAGVDTLSGISIHTRHPANYVKQVGSL